MYGRQPAWRERRIKRLMVARGTVVMVATARHPGFKSCSCRFFSLLRSLQAGCLPYINILCLLYMFLHIHADVTLTDVSKLAFEGREMARGSGGSGSGRGVADHGPPGEDRRRKCQGQST